MGRVFFCMVKIAIGCPSPDKVPAEFIHNLLGIMSYTKAHSDYELHYVYKTGVRTDRNRNIILEQAIKNGMDYILWLDTDMLYPHDIIIKYMEKEFDIMGCLYFKRADSYDPVGYVNGDRPGVFKPLDVRLLPKNKVIEVDGLGFGGMMVNMEVYEKMGQDKWMHYSHNFHLPYDTEEPKLTHDLQFCIDAKRYGAKILLHTGIKPGHLAEIPITEKEWLQNLKNEAEKQPTIAVIMPTIHVNLAEKTKKILQKRAGIECDIKVILDYDKKGYVWNCNEFVNNTNYDYYVYLTDDIFPSRNWLKQALDLMKKKQAGLVGFNDGKWQGTLATCGLVDATWMKKNYEGNLFNPDYFCHYNDTELTLYAMQQSKYAYDPNISLIEIDYEKDNKKVNPKDREIFRIRKSVSFDGWVTDDKLKALFS